MQAQAVRLFSIAQRLNPLNAEYPYLYAKANMALAGSESVPSIDQAIRDGFDRAVALNPWYVKYQIDQARYLLSKGDAESVTVYENLTRIDPGDPGTFTSLAWAYHLLYQNDAKAMQSLDQAFAIDKNYYEAWLVLGRIQEARGRSLRRSHPTGRQLKRTRPTCRRWAVWAASTRRTETPREQRVWRLSFCSARLTLQRQVGLRGLRAEYQA